MSFRRRLVHRARLRSLSWLALIIAGATAHANTVDALVAQLSSADDHVRAQARQLLPREGVDALPAVLPLINHESEPVWRAAYNVVADIANQACAPGHEADRVRSSELLMQWLAPEQTPRAHEYGLRLIGYIVPPGFTVEPIAWYLHDEGLRDYAREALELIGSDEARRALEQALAASNPDVQLALIRSLERMHRAESLPAFMNLMEQSEPAVRAAAARAAAAFGDPLQAARFRMVLSHATPETQFAATDATLRYADALATSGGNWALGIRLFQEVLDSSPQPALQAAAMMGLGRFGDESCVAALVGHVLASQDQTVLQALPLALGALRGNAALEAALAEYPRLPDVMRPSVLRALTGTPHPALAALVTTELQAADASVRNAALAAATRIASPAFLAPLMAIVQSGSEHEREAALSAALQIARAPQGGGDDAGLALLRLYPHATDYATRAEILGALAEYPAVDALDVAMNAAETPELAAAAVPLLVALLKPLHEAGQRARVREVFAKVMELNESPEAVLGMAANLGAAGAELGLAELLGTIQTWEIIGPFPWNGEEDWAWAFVSEPHVVLADPVSIDGRSLAWQSHATSDSFGTVNLIDVLGPAERAFAYAYAVVEVPRAYEAQLRVGTDDGVVAWVNGAKVWENRVDRGMSVDKDIVTVQLQAGTNSVLLKISQGAGGWGFCARITDTAGAGIAGG